MANNKNSGSKSSPAPAAAKPAAAAPAKSSSNNGTSAQIKAAASDGRINANEALKIAKDTGKTVAEVMVKAVDKGVALGSGLVNKYNAGAFGPNGNNVVEAYGLSIPVGAGLSGKGAQAITQLEYLNNLRMQPGTSFAGYSTTKSPLSNQATYNPIVLPNAYLSSTTAAKPAAPAPAAPAPAAPAPTTPIQNWQNSVDASNQALIDSINKQIAANSTQAELYMGQINDLMASLAQANKGGGLQNITPYATTTSMAPAAGAQMTQAITARKKPTNTDLSISPFVGDTAGTGLNIAI